MNAFDIGQRVAIVHAARLERAYGVEAASWLMARVGTVQAGPQGSEAAWVRFGEPLPRPLRGKHPDRHPYGRNVLLFPWECQLAQDRSYAPFHRVEFTSALDDACRRFDQAYLIPALDPTRPELSWWRDATDELRSRNDVGLWERVFRFGVEQRKVTLLVYSTVSTSTDWSRPASTDAIRFVHEARLVDGAAYLETQTRVNRTGTLPLDRVADRILELMSPDHVRALRHRAWAPTFWRRAQ